MRLNGKLMFVGFVALMSFYLGAKLHKEGKFPFGPSGIKKFFRFDSEVKTKSDTSSPKTNINPEWLRTSRDADLKNLPLQRATAIQKLLGAENALSFLYSDLNYRINPDAKICAPIERESEFFNEFRKQIGQCFKIYYEEHTFETYSILLKGRGRPSELIIYNHGHGGLPKRAEKQEHFAFELIHKLLNRGHDVLITSMPFRGLNRLYAPATVTTFDGLAVVNNSAAPHNILETLDVGRSHPMRFFVDSALLPYALLMRKYQKVHYVGLSGGSVTGLPTCVLLQRFLGNCILAAGVMPLDILVEFPDRNLTDVEQYSHSFYSKISVRKMLSILSNSKVNVSLVYNDEDPCCFASTLSEKFKRTLDPNSRINFHIRQSRKHSFDPDQILELFEKKTNV